MKASGVSILKLNTYAQYRMPDTPESRFLWVRILVLINGLNA